MFHSAAARKGGSRWWFDSVDLELLTSVELINRLPIANNTIGNAKPAVKTKRSDSMIPSPIISDVVRRHLKYFVDCILLLFVVSAERCQQAAPEG